MEFERMDFDTEARWLLEPLRDRTAPPSTLDIGGAVKVGRRRLRARRWAGVGAAAAFSLVPVSLALVMRPEPAPPPQALDPVQSASPSAVPPVAKPAFPVSCTAGVLPLPAGVTSATVEKGDPSGRYLVGGYADEQGNRRPLFWDNGNLVTLFTPGQDNSSVVVNEQGVVAGSSTTVLDGKLEFHNWIYRNGTVSPITEVGRGMAEHRGVIDINARGDVLLDSRTKVSPQAVHQGPALWSNGTLRELTKPTGLQEVIATSLDDDGTVVGRHLLQEGFAGERPLVWSPDGKVEELKVANGFGPAGSLLHVRGGWAGGVFATPGKPDHEQTHLVGDLRSGTFAPAGIKLGFGMNRHGWVAGFDAGPDRTQIPAIAGDGKKLLLPIPEGTRAAEEISAASISDDGRTVGGTVMAAGKQDHVPVRWTCNP